MHRDISRANILCHPQHMNSNVGDRDLARLPYIDGLLYAFRISYPQTNVHCIFSETAGPNRSSTTSHALITDLDHSEDMKWLERLHQHQQQPKAGTHPPAPEAGFGRTVSHSFC